MGSDSWLWRVKQRAERSKGLAAANRHSNDQPQAAVLGYKTHRNWSLYFSGRRLKQSAAVLVALPPMKKQSKLHVLRKEGSQLVENGEKYLESLI
ncbi:hypothetical protein AAC387_Pa11g0666 [Persea americana]